MYSPNPILFPFTLINRKTTFLSLPRNELEAISNRMWTGRFDLLKHPMGTSGSGSSSYGKLRSHVLKVFHVFIDSTFVYVVSIESEPN